MGELCVDCEVIFGLCDGEFLEDAVPLGVVLAGDAEHGCAGFVGGFDDLSYEGVV